MKPLHREAIWTLALLVGMSVLFMLLPANAHDIVDVNVDSSTTNNYYTSEAASNGGGMSTLRTSMEDEIAAGVATAAALSFCQFDYSPVLQACFGTATYNDEWALSAQMGKRIDTMLLTGGFACDDSFNECAAGGAISFHF